MTCMGCKLVLFFGKRQGSQRAELSVILGSEVLFQSLGPQMATGLPRGI